MYYTPFLLDTLQNVCYPCSRLRIESEIKLDYKDVLLRPKRSTLESRKDVDLVREFTFPNAGGEGSDPKAYGWKGVPIVASNMDTVGTFEMAKALARHRMLTCISKHNDLKRWLHNIYVKPYNYYN